MSKRKGSIMYLSVLLLFLGLSGSTSAEETNIKKGNDEALLKKTKDMIEGIDKILKEYYAVLEDSLKARHEETSIPVSEEGPTTKNQPGPSKGDSVAQEEQPITYKRLQEIYHDLQERRLDLNEQGARVQKLKEQFESNKNNRELLSMYRTESLKLANDWEVYREDVKKHNELKAKYRPQQSK